MLKIKKILTLGIISTSILSIASCAHNNPNNPSSNTPILDSTPSPSTDDLPNSSSSETRVPVEDIGAFVESIGNNYTFDEYFYITGADAHTKILRDGNNAFDEIDNTYYTLEGETLYSITQNEKEEWHKNFSEKTLEEIFDQKNYLVELLNNFTWRSYDESTNTFIGTGDYAQNNNIEVQLQISPTELNLTSTGGYTKLTNLDKTTVALPTNIKDDTIKSEKIYENGRFNIVLMNEVLTDWMKGNNQFDRDIIVEYIIGSGKENLSLDRIVYINASLQDIEFGCTYNYSSELNRFYSLHFQDASLYESLANGTISTKDDFIAYLNTGNLKNFKINSTTYIDNTIPKDDFSTMTTNIFNRLAEVGYQGRDISNEGTKVEGLKPENVIYSFATVKGDVFPGLGLGYKREWSHYYLINNNDACRWIKVGIASSEPKSELGPNYMVINDELNCWYVTSYEETILDKGNANFHTITTEINRKL